MNLLRAAVIAALSVTLLSGCASAEQGLPASSQSAPTTNQSASSDGGYEQGLKDGSQSEVFTDPVPAGHSAEYARGWAAGQAKQQKLFEKEQAAHAKPFLTRIRTSWAKESKPYTDEELRAALDDLCYIDPGDYWDLSAWNKARDESLIEDGVKNATLRRALMGEAARKHGYCEE